MANIAIRIKPAQDLMDNINVNGTKITIADNEFTFKDIFNGETQFEVYENLIMPLVDDLKSGLFEGGAVLAYGQTGTGKTYTMGTEAHQTDENEMGIIPRVLKHLFEDDGMTVSMSFLEVYREQVYDLLHGGSNATLTKPPKLAVRDFQARNASVCVLKNLQDALKMLKICNQRRRIGSTNANLKSSRSHAILTLTFARETSVSKLSLVDLAGSESTTDVIGQQAKEAIEINKGLLQLKNVVTALSTDSHIPYRNSKLTSVLQDVLNAKNRIIFISCISPHSEDSVETTATLKFSREMSCIPFKPDIKSKVTKGLGTTTPFKRPFTPVKKPFTPTYRPFTSAKRPLTPGSVNKINNTFSSPASKRKTDCLRRNNTFCSPTFYRTQASKVDRTDSGFTSSTPVPLPRNILNSNSSLFTDISNINFAPTPAPRSRLNIEKNPVPVQEDVLNISSSTTLDEDSTNVTARNVENQVNEHMASNKIFLSEGMKRLIRGFITKEVQKEKQDTIVSNQPRLSRALEFLDGGSPILKDSSVISKNISSPLVETPQPTVSSILTSRADEETLDDSDFIPTEPVLKKKNVNAPVRRSVRLSFANSKRRSPFNQTAHKTVINKTRRRIKTPPKISILSPKEPKVKNFYKHLLQLLNTGDTKQMQTLYSIGPKTASMIWNHRQLHGPLKRLEDLGNILSQGVFSRFLKSNGVSLS